VTFKPSPFVALQSAESRLIRALIGAESAEWVLEIAPATSPSPEVAGQRCRVMFNAEGCCWPFRAPFTALPIDSESVPALILRHAWQPHHPGDLLDEVMRVLRPGGWLISVSANPWHPAAWRELGRQALWLPSWPQFQMLHARRALSLATPGRNFWQGLVPGLTPILALRARKPSRPARIRPMPLRRPRFASAPVAATQCRAA
jgi:SAM-dependent methyltransferase